MQADLSKPWLSVPYTNHQPAYRKIIINRTARWQNVLISYFFMERYRDRMLFAGTEEERDAFAKEWHFAFELEYLKVTNFQELAQAMLHCKFFIGNQSMCYSIAEGLKIPRILELCPFSPNVHPVGKHAHYFQFQRGLTYLVDKLDKEL
jgi:hypothetical protein